MKRRHSGGGFFDVNCMEIRMNEGDRPRENNFEGSAVGARFDEYTRFVAVRILLDVLSDRYARAL